MSLANRQRKLLRQRNNFKKSGCVLYASVFLKTSFRNAFIFTNPFIFDIIPMKQSGIVGNKNKGDVNVRYKRRNKEMF